jgi:hypothetical protein
MQGTPLISPIFGTAALKDTGLVEGTVPIRIAGGALVGPMAWSQITTTPTTLNGYGITDGVRSVGLSLPAQFTLSDSPVTGTGTLTAVWASQTQSHVLAAPINGNGTPAFRALVATDIPTLNQNTTGTAANVTGIVAISNGGTGATTDATARTALGATTVGSNLFTLPNPSAITFPRLNDDNSVSALNAADFRTAISAQALDPDLEALAALATTGLIDRTGAGTATTRTTGTTGLNVLAAANEAAARAAIGAMADTDPVIVTNANGTAYRWPNGLQICRFQSGSSTPTPIAWGSLYISSLLQYTFPAAFNAIPSVEPTYRFVTGEGGSVAWGVTQAITTTTTAIYALSAFAAGGCRMGYIAIGTYTP